MDIQKELFELFQKRRSDFELYEELKKFITKVENQVKGEAASQYYLILEKIECSINNAGHERRRDADIAFLKQEKRKIVDEFEEFLP